MPFRWFFASYCVTEPGCFDVIFLRREHAQSVYEELLDAVRENRGLAELDIRDRQTAAGTQ